MIKESIHKKTKKNPICLYLTTKCKINISTVTLGNIKALSNGHRRNVSGTPTVSTF